MQVSPFCLKPAIVVIVLLAIPIVANALALFGFVDPHSELMFSGLQENVVPGSQNGRPFIDPSGGTTYEPEAREALRQWLSGAIPWWNHFEGVGFPLAGGIVPGVFSPYLLLLALPNSVILQQVIGQIFCGLFTYKALRLIGCSRSASLVGGALYELNGTFAWLGSVWSMPMVALPLWICGIEAVRSDDRRAGWLGIACIAAATYIAIVSSFIETGFLEGLFVIAWFVARLPAFKARGAFRYAAICAVGGAIGLFLAAPQIVAFADVLKYGVSIHHSGIIGLRGIPTEGVSQLFLPYLWGPIFKYSALNSVWGSVGGYAGMATLVVASAAFSSRKARPLIVMLTAWIALTVGAEFAAPLPLKLINLIPGVKFTAQYRYSPPTWEFALVILCGLLLSEWQDDPRFFLRAAHRIALASLAVTLAGFTYLHAATIEQLSMQQDYSSWLIFSLITGVAVVGVMLVCMNRPGVTSVRVLSIVLVGEALLYYVLPTSSYPKSGSIDTGYLHAFHEGAGYSRLYSINALQPDFGSLYQIPLINYSDVVVPKNYVQFVQQLEPYDDHGVLFLPYRLNQSPDAPTIPDVLAWHRRQFESLAVKYIDGTPDQLLPSFSPAIQAGQLPFALGEAELAGEFGGLLKGDGVTGVQFSVIAAGLPDGIVSVKLCSGANCVFADAPLNGTSPQDQLFELKFTKPLLIASRRVSFTIRQSRYHRPAHIWLYPRGSNDETVIGQSGVFPSFQFRTRLMLYRVPTSVYANEALDLARSPINATIPAPDSGGSIVSIAVMEVGHGGAVRVRLCSEHCVFGESAGGGSAPDGYVEIPLANPLKIETAKLRAEFSEADTRHAEYLALYSETPYFPQAISYDGKLMAGLALKAHLNVVSALPIEVYRGSKVSLFRLSSAEPYFAARNCQLKPSSRDELVAHCQQGSTLIRRELYYPGWTASVNGVDAKIRLHGEILQELALPQGQSLVHFRYEPHYAQLALVLSGLGLVLLAACISLGLRSSHRLVSAVRS